MKKKAAYREILVEYLAMPENLPPSRGCLSTEVLGFRQTQQIYKIFTLEELADIEREALALRRARYASHMARTDRALLKKAAGGDVHAAKLAYQRFEGWGEKRALKATCGANLSVHVAFVGGGLASVVDVEFE